MLEAFAYPVGSVIHGSAAHSHSLLLFHLFYPPTESSGGYSNEPGVGLSSVRPSVNIFVSALLLEYRLEYFDDTSQLRRTGHDDVSYTKLRALTFYTF